MARLLLTVGMIALAAQAAPVVPDDLSADQLSMVVDAAITRLAGRDTWWTDQKNKHSFENAVQVFTCTPDDTKWIWPAMEEAHGLLKRVFDSGELKVAGVQWGDGSVANYKTDPENPTGFWPEYLDAMVAEINVHYNTTITIKREYYDDSNLVIAAVADGRDVDMSEPYYYISGFHDNTPRIEALHSSCVTAGTQGNFITKAGSGITTMSQLYQAIDTGALKDVGFIAAGNAQSVSSILPPTTFKKIGITNDTQLADQVANGQIIAGYVSEGHPPQPERFNDLIPTGIVTPRVVLFRKDEPTCAGTETNDSGMVAGLVVLALAVLLLVGTLAIFIYRERRGVPVFPPLSKQEHYDVTTNEMHNMESNRH
eukprot:CAMPEP_0118944498 /NCGR_PEP_ID=MMETSP1169-20130426/40411_1 /TAXON_ID=36882 /ORGANISM="Pyramimonas obovata, Strain CCMP722" /LENGTH=368 /DNA_ID=CAMNT_0006889995 /DNA_START=15 /DNA_END=1121 /DNA_ORIENTATION=+